jgi:hypothetical protein
MKPLPSRFVLAATPWPRTAGDRRNSSHVSIEGPRHGRVAVAVDLPGSDPDGRAWSGGGIAMGTDGALIVVAHGRVSRIAVDGTILSVASIPLPGPDPRGNDELTADANASAIADGSNLDAQADTAPRRTVVVPPIALADGAVVVLASPELLVFDASGHIGGAYVGSTPDDSMLAPNVTHGGALVLTHMTGTVELFADGQRRELDGVFGYDIVPPAIYPDDAMAIAGYAGTGLICVTTDGTRRWSTDLKDTDHLPAIDVHGFAAVGSLNDQRSIIVAPDGTLVGSIPRTGTFAEAEAGDWFVRTRDMLARVRRDGSPVWMERHSASPELRWGAQAPVADAAERVYTLATSSLIARDARKGNAAFHAELGGAPASALALVAPGLAALLVGQRLLLIE